MTSPWTDERVERLTELWRDGMRTGLIGLELGLSKSSIISKAHRLNLPGRASPISRRRVSVPKLATGAPVVRRWQVSQAQSNSVRRIRAENGQSSLPWAMTRQFLSVRGMRFATCQWISGEPSVDDRCKCGQPTAGGPWCGEHAVRARGQGQPGAAA